MANDLEQKIIKQIEFYFGDYNLPRDKFLKQKTTENDGWVDLSVLLTFSRLANLSTDTEVIVKALEKSENGIVAVSEDGTKIRRVPGKPVPEFDDDRKKKLTERTAYAKGFPLDESLDDILSFLEQQGEIEACLKRTYHVKEHKFKGSCFIIFKTVEDCKKFIEAESIKYKDVELLRKWQNDYYEEKRREVRNHKQEKKDKKNQKEAEQSNKTVTYPKGVFFHFSGLSDDNVLTREEIREKITEINEVAPSFIDFNKGDKEGYVRMPTENGASEFYNKLTDGVFEIGDAKLQCKVVEGEEEDLCVKKAAAHANMRRKYPRKSNKRKGDYLSRGPSAKKSKH